MADNNFKSFPPVNYDNSVINSLNYNNYLIQLTTGYYYHTAGIKFHTYVQVNRRLIQSST